MDDVFGVMLLRIVEVEKVARLVRTFNSSWIRNCRILAEMQMTSSKNFSLFSPICSNEVQIRSFIPGRGEHERSLSEHAR